MASPNEHTAPQHTVEQPFAPVLPIPLLRCMHLPDHNPMQLLVMPVRQVRNVNQQLLILKNILFSQPGSIALPRLMQLRHKLLPALRKPVSFYLTPLSFHKTTLFKCKPISLPPVTKL